jgi:hypothetical protein
MTAHHDTAPVSDRLGHAAGRSLDESLTIRGRVRLELRNAHGDLLELRDVQNLITTVGRNMIVDRLLAAPALASPTHMAVGTAAAAPAVGDTALGAEVARVALTSKTRATNVLTLVGDYPAGTGTGALTEAGTFDAATTGNMPSRATFAVINKGAADTLKITWTWTIG